MEQQQKKKNDNLINYFKTLVSDFPLLFCYYLRCVYCFLRKIFDYDFFVKSNSIKDTKPAAFEFSEVEDDQNDLVELPNVRNALKERAVITFYTSLSFPHPVFFDTYSEFKLFQKNKKTFDFCQFYLGRFTDGKTYSFISGPVSVMKKDSVDIGGYFNATTFKTYYYVLLNPKFQLSDAVSDDFFEEEDDDSIEFFDIEPETALHSVNNAANLNLIAKDTAFTVTVVKPTVSYNVLNYRIQLNLFEKSLNYFLTDSTILVKNLIYKLTTLVKLVMVKFGFQKDWFLKKEISVQNVQQNIFSDLLHNTQLNSLKRPNVVEPYDFYSDLDETFNRNLDFYFFNKLRLLKAIRCLDRDYVNPELRSKLFLKYYNFYLKSNYNLNYEQLLKNFIHYKTNNDKDLIIYFNQFIKNRPYVKELLFRDIPFYRGYDFELFRDPTTRIIKSNNSFSTIADFLTTFYVNKFAEVKLAYFDIIKNDYVIYRDKKTTLSALNTKFRKPKTTKLQILKLKSHFTKLYNFNFVELGLQKPFVFDDAVVDVDDEYEDRKYIFRYPIDLMSVRFDEDYDLADDVMVNTTEHVTEIIKSYPYLLPESATSESFITRFLKEHTDHLDIPLYFSTPYNMFQVKYLYNDPLQNQLPLITTKQKKLALLQDAAQTEVNESVDAVLDLKLINNYFNSFKKIDPVYFKTVEFSDEKKIRTTAYKKTISFNNKFEFPKITEDIFLFNLWPNLVTKIDSKRLNFSGFSNFFISCVLLHFVITIFRLVLTFNNKQKLEKVFTSVYDTYLFFVTILAIMFFFLFFFFDLNGFFLITQHVLLAISVFERETVPKVQLDVDTVSEEPKLNFSLLRFKIFKNFFSNPSVSNVSNNNFLFNKEDRGLGENLYGLSFIKPDTEEDVELEFDEVSYSNKFKFFDASQFVIVVLNFSWANFYGLIFSIFFSLFIFKNKFETVSDKNKLLYLVLVMLFEILLVSGYYVSATVSLVQGFIVSGYWIFFLIFGITLLYFIHKLK